MLRDGPLLGEWYILYRLQEEMERARRYQRPVSVMVAAPVLLAGQEASPVVFAVGAAAAEVSSRSTDLLGRLGRDTILVLMPETGRDEASAAASRWLSEIWLRSRNVNGPKWRAAAIDNVSEFETPAQVVEAALQEMADSA